MIRKATLALTVILAFQGPAFGQGFFDSVFGPGGLGVTGGGAQTPQFDPQQYSGAGSQPSAQYQQVHAAASTRRPAARRYAPQQQGVRLRSSKATTRSSRGTRSRGTPPQQGYPQQGYDPQQQGYAQQGYAPAAGVSAAARVRSAAGVSAATRLRPAAAGVRAARVPSAAGVSAATGISAAGRGTISGLEQLRGHRSGV